MSIKNFTVDDRTCQGSNPCYHSVWIEKEDGSVYDGQMPGDVINGIISNISLECLFLKSQEPTLQTSHFEAEKKLKLLSHIHSYRQLKQKTLDELLQNVSFSKPSSSMTYPDEFICPITHEIMKDPVLTPEGICYDRAAIVEWVNRKYTCPSSRNPLTEKQLIPNLPLKALIQNWKRQQPASNKKDLVSSSSSTSSSSSSTSSPSSSSSSAIQNRHSQQTASNKKDLVSSSSSTSSSSAASKNRALKLSPNYEQVRLDIAKLRAIMSLPDLDRFIDAEIWGELQNRIESLENSHELWNANEPLKKKVLSTLKQANNLYNQYEY